MASEAHPLLPRGSLTLVQTVDMHTCGEPVRIVYAGWPDMEVGTLLEQRRQARNEFDHHRSRLMLEPRGHDEMYGALLRPTTEHTTASPATADMGVLFMTATSFSTMCGHATIALSRFLVDTHDPSIFPRRDTLPFDQETNTVRLRLHAPCGVLHVTVPTTSDGKKSDPTRRVRFLGVPSYAVAIDKNISIPSTFQWPELNGGSDVTVDCAFGGTFYAIVRAKELGWTGGLRDCNIERLKSISASLKAVINQDTALCKELFKAADKDLQFLYSVLIVDDTLGEPEARTLGVETGLCFFADSQIDRSPTGGSVMARLPVAVAKGKLALNQSWTYHSVVSAAFKTNCFIGTGVERVQIPSGIGGEQIEAIITQVEGNAYYTGAHTFILEEGDTMSAAGFRMKDIAARISKQT